MLLLESSLTSSSMKPSSLLSNPFLHRCLSTPSSSIALLHLPYRHGGASPSASKLASFVSFHPPTLPSSLNNRSLAASSLSRRWNLAIGIAPAPLAKRALNFSTHAFKLQPPSPFDAADVGSALVLTGEDKVLERQNSYSSLFPCPQQNSSPRIEHLLLLRDGNIVDLVSDALALPRSYVEELIHFGAVYYALVCPPPPQDSLAPEKMSLYKKICEHYGARKRPSIRSIPLSKAQKTVRITSIYEGVEAGTYARVHVHPKRFPRCYEVDWRSRVIAETESFVVLHKPAGIPVGGSVDNLDECCVTFTTRSLGLPSPLRPTHQIDNCTEGCQDQDKKVKKYYRALAAAPVSLGRISHFMDPGRRHPRILSTEPIPGWAPCALEVLECQEVKWPSAAREADNKIQDSGWMPKEVAYECKINLVTGRTHQIRAQLAALGAPLVGDSMYMPAALSCLRSPEVYPLFTKNGKAEISESVMKKWVSAHGPETEHNIGLQASQISWDDGSFDYRAGEPWWRT